MLMGEPSDLVSESQKRALSLLDFLEAFYRRRYPPVRDIAKYGDFLVREQDFPAVPGVILSPGGNRWLTVKLVAHPAAPELPAELVDYVEDSQVNAQFPPKILADDNDAEERLIAQEVLGGWIAEIWTPWSEGWRQVEKGRSFYKSVFDLRTRVDRDREALELVWGFGRLQWRCESEDVDHPLLTVPMEIDHNRTDGSLSFVPASAATVEYSFLTELPLADRIGYLDRRRSAEEIELDPWNSETIEKEYEGLLRSIDLDGTIGGTLSEGHAVVSSDWCVYLRRRQADYLGFLEMQRQIIRENPEAIPLPIASLVVDEPSRLAGEGGQWGETEDVELLLPLPANEEQHAILRKASKRAGVTAQGPPGTGKTHTIANLISHYVAHGQRVLVVAEKEQAIKVIAEKVPAGIRALVVSNLGSDAESRTRLEQSITSIQAGVFSTATVPTTAELERRQVAMDDFASKIALLSSELRDRSVSEHMPCPPAISIPSRSTPSEVATWLAENADTLGYIPDRLPVGEPCPVSASELKELSSIVRDVDPSELEEARRYLPPLTLPASSVLAESDRECEQAAMQLTTSAITDWSAIDVAGSEVIDEIARQIDDAWSKFTGWSGSWFAEVCNELWDREYFRTWSEFTVTARRERDVALAHSRSLMTHVVEIPEVIQDPAAFRRNLELARDRFTSGRGLGLWSREIRGAIDGCLVDGTRPATAEAVQICIEEVELRESRRRLATGWTNQTQRVGAPRLASPTPEHELGDSITELEWLLMWRTSRWPSLVEALGELGMDAPEIPTEEDIARLRAASMLFRTRRREQFLIRERTQLVEFLSSEAQRDGAAPLWIDLQEALSSHDWERWDMALQRCHRLRALRESSERAADIESRLEKSAPLWAASITDSRGAAARDPASLADAWMWRCAETWISDLNNRRSAAELQRLIEDANKQRLRAVEELVVGLAWRNLASRFNDRHRIALQQYVTASKRLGKGHSKYAARFQNEVRSALNDAREVVPVWIMTISKALESFRPSSEPPFDVLIVDEASQVGLEAIPILGLARRAIIVGDDKQTSPENVGLQREAIFELIDEHLQEIPKHRTLFDPDTSLYDLAAIKFPDIVMLREHFRCLPEIIAFSNNRYYDGKIEALRDRRPSRNWSPTGTVDVKIGYRKSGPDINENEAVAVVDLISDLIERPEYDGMTFGVISMLGTKQAPRIQELLLDRLGPTVVEERRIRCGDASNFQGDERDVIIISLVVGPNESGQLGRIGAMTGKPAERRMNVAASRAANQLWVVHSVQPEDFPSGDPRSELIRHCRQPVRLDEMSDRLLEKCESEFERRVVRDILARGYRHVKVQWVVGNYRIDLVVEGPDGRRLAVECDGDAWHGIDRWDQDRARQTVLERSGWTFERVSGSAYFRDPAGALEPLWERLEEMGIPTGEWAEHDNAPPPRRVIDQVPLSVTEFGVEDTDEEQIRGELHVISMEEVEPTQPFAGDSDNAVWPIAVHTEVNRERSMPSARSSDDSLLKATPLHHSQTLQPYEEWQSVPLLLATEATLDYLVEALVNVVQSEGPILARRAYLLCHQAARGHRVGKDIQSHFNRAADRAIRQGRLSQLQDIYSGQMERTLYVPTTPSVVVRSLGPRELYDVPKSEVRTLIERLGLEGARTEVACRVVLDAYGLRKMTQKATSFIEECRRYRWVEG